MISCPELSEIFMKNELKFFTGVPDSTFKDWMRFLAANPEGNLVNRVACNECEAIALASGYHFSTGKVGVVYMQNAGLGKTINPLTSLASKEVYSVPMILMIGWRGEPGKKDEPQHKMMGRIMMLQLDILEIPYKILPDNIDEAEKIIEWAKQIAEQNKYVAAIIIKKGMFKEYEFPEKRGIEYELSREEAIKTIVDNISEQATVISTTGKTSRELFEYREEKKEKHERDFLTVGSMGCSSSISLEIALQKPDKSIYLFDGDGASLMQLGSLATIGHNNPENLTHIIFDSTGGQPTISETVNFTKIAEACGYNCFVEVKRKQDLIVVLNETKQKGPKMIVVKVKKGARKDLMRPTSTPIENKDSFMKFLKK